MILNIVPAKCDPKKLVFKKTNSQTLSKARLRAPEYLAPKPILGPLGYAFFSMKIYINSLDSATVQVSDVVIGTSLTQAEVYPVWRLKLKDYAQ